MTTATDSAPRARASLARRLTVVALITLATFVVFLEIASRIADRAASDGHPAWLARIAFATLDPAAMKIENARTQPHPYLGYSLTPSYRSKPGDAQQISHNSLGFRGRETTWEKPPGTFRIVTTGGSSVYGQSESKDEAVWSARLEEHLRAALPGRDIEVINGGCSGWSTFEMLINLELRMIDFDPDLVVVYEAINDVRCALYTLGGPVKHDNTHWRQPFPVDRPSKLEKLFEKSRAYLIWRRYMTNYINERGDLAYFAIVNSDPKNPNWYQHAPDKVPELGFTSYRRNLENIVTVAEKHGAKVVIATQALARWHLDEHGSRDVQLAAFDRILDIQREVARERGVTVIESGRVVEEALERELAAAVESERARRTGEPEETIVREGRKAFMDENAKGVGLFKREVHPNDSGSDLVARTIADGILRAGLIR
jgi:lysophospholipase L1-like esterase